MTDTNLHQLYFNCQLANKSQAVELIGELGAQLTGVAGKPEIIKLLNEREAVGSTMIADHVLLPHIESASLKESRIIYLHLERPIPFWSETDKDIRLIIVILLKHNETMAIKKQISLAVRKLADEAFVETLINMETEGAFKKALMNV
ncbi:PTS sugar transporter subunit IIA [Vagococcus sp. BWB3-3]|uniref:PTS sugar transporter subunit IIA n=1 Tax=Vagococcus allomyrinae TaxID=2794353 RepID=A0A940P7F7_9ENTE|nr:PTS sugar transporter subunit IIA [Vagococcus allomyrinae]MBP1042470.1 PTS sugar transporter subunit IIA [Vagococcus allomyrinae]